MVLWLTLPCECSLLSSFMPTVRISRIPSISHLPTCAGSQKLGVRAVSLICTYRPLFPCVGCFMGRFCSWAEYSIEAHWLFLEESHWTWSDPLTHFPRDPFGLINYYTGDKRKNILLTVYIIPIFKAFYLQLTSVWLLIN